MTKLRVSLAVAIAAMAAVASVTAARHALEVCAVDWWPQSRQNACSSGGAANEAAPSPANVGHLERRWTHHVEGGVGQPIVWKAPGMRAPLVYAAGGGRLHALELASGRTRWSARTGPDLGAAVAAGDLLIHHGGLMRRYVPGSGHIVWARGGGYVGRFPSRLVLAGSRLYVPSDFGVEAFDARTGRSRWGRFFENGGPDVAATAGRVYVYGDGEGSDDPQASLHALDAETGRTIWKSMSFPSTWTSPILAGGRVFIREVVRRPGGSSFWVRAFRAADGTPLWRANVGSATREWFTPPTADGSLVVHLSEDGFVYALDAETGARRWRVRIGYSRSRPALVNGLVWVGNGDGRLLALDASNGRRLWGSTPLRLAEQQELEPVIAGRFVLVAASGSLLAFTVS